MTQSTLIDDTGRRAPRPGTRRHRPSRVRLARFLAVAGLLVTGLVAAANPAGAATPGWYGRYITSGFPTGTNGYIKWWAYDCGADDPYIRPGSQGIITENGTNGITQLKVQYLYQVPSSTTSSGWANLKSSPVYSSPQFPNDSGNHTYPAQFYRFTAFVPPDGGRMAIKFTFAKPYATDINVTQAVAYC